MSVVTSMQMPQVSIVRSMQNPRLIKLIEVVCKETSKDEEACKYLKGFVLKT